MEVHKKNLQNKVCPTVVPQKNFQNEDARTKMRHLILCCKKNTIVQQ